MYEHSYVGLPARDECANRFIKAAKFGQGERRTKTTRMEGVDSANSIELLSAVDELSFFPFSFGVRLFRGVSSALGFELEFPVSDFIIGTRLTFN